MAYDTWYIMYHSWSMIGIYRQAALPQYWISFSLTFPAWLAAFPFSNSLMAETRPENNLSLPYNKTPDHVDVQHEDDQSSFSSNAAQTGVKNIEVVSQTWTQSSLIAAYLGWAFPLQSHPSFQKERVPDKFDSLIKRLVHIHSRLSEHQCLTRPSDFFIAFSSSPSVPPSKVRRRPTWPSTQPARSPNTR